MTLLVEIDEAEGLFAAVVEEDRLALEDVVVAIGIAGLRVRRRNFEDRAEIEKERVLVRPLGCAGRSPSGNEVVELHEARV